MCEKNWGHFTCAGEMCVEFFPSHFVADSRCKISLKVLRDFHFEMPFPVMRLVRARLFGQEGLDWLHAWWDEKEN